MSNRHVDSLAQTTFLKDDDYLLTEEDGFLRKIKVSSIEKILKFDTPFNSTPASYTGYQISGGKSVYSKRSLYFAVISMMEAVYGDLTESRRLKLYVVHDDTFREATFVLFNEVVTVTFADDLSTLTFTQDEWTGYDACLISPWGLVPNTDDFTKDLSEESLANRTVAFSDEQQITSFTTTTGKIFIENETDKILPFYVLYKDAANYLLLYYLDSRLYANYVTEEITFTMHSDALDGENIFEIYLDPTTKECTVTFNSNVLTLQVSEGNAFGYEDGGDTFIFGTLVGEVINAFELTTQLDNPVTIYIGKDFNNSYFYSPIYDIT